MSEKKRLASVHPMGTSGPTIVGTLRRNFTKKEALQLTAYMILACNEIACADMKTHVAVQLARDVQTFPNNQWFKKELGQ